MNYDNFKNLGNRGKIIWLTDQITKLRHFKIKLEETTQRKHLEKIIWTAFHDIVAEKGSGMTPLNSSRMACLGVQ